MLTCLVVSSIAESDPTSSLIIGSWKFLKSSWNFMCILENFDIIHQKYNLMTFVYYVAVDLEVCITGTNKDSYFLCRTVTVAYRVIVSTDKKTFANILH